MKHCKEADICMSMIHTCTISICVGKTYDVYVEHTYICKQTMSQGPAAKSMTIGIICGDTINTIARHHLASTAILPAF